MTHWRRLHRWLRRAARAANTAGVALLEIADAILAPSPLPPRARGATPAASVTVHPDRREARP